MGGDGALACWAASAMPRTAPAPAYAGAAKADVRRFDSARAAMRRPAMVTV